MSADFYPTPAWATERLLENYNLDPTARCLEPCVGDGAIVRAIRESHPVYSDHGHWVGGDIIHRLPTSAFLPPFLDEFHMVGYDHWSESLLDSFDCVISNPPFNLAYDIVQHFVERHPLVIMLLRITFAGSQKRNQWLLRNQPSVIVLPQRFRQVSDRNGTKKVGGDNVERAWFIWDQTRVPPTNFFKIARY